MEQEACRIGILLRAPGVVDVGAPMKYKELCYEILADAARVIHRTHDEVAFTPRVTNITIVMQMTGLVDVAAPLPPREVCYEMLRLARDVIERFNDDSAPELRPFSRQLMGETENADSLSPPRIRA